MKRGDPDNGPLDLLKDYLRNLIHDHFIPYYTYLSNAIHCECNDHIRRYLKAGIDLSDSIPCRKMITLLLKISVEYEHIIDDETKAFEKVNPNLPKEYVQDYIKAVKKMKKYESERLRQ